ncbi:MAG: hypothetical protein AB4041_04335 [Microcystaceae cyanobacterium]
MKISSSVSGLVRTFAYFMASGTHCYLEGIHYLELYGENPSVIEQAYAILINVIELDENGVVTNPDYAQKRATDFIRRFVDETYEVSPPFEEWELKLYALPRG